MTGRKTIRNKWKRVSQQLLISRNVVLTKQGVGMHSKTSHFKTGFKRISKQNIAKVWERRSHLFPPHYIPVDKWVHALVLTNSLTELSLIVNRKMKYWIAMSTIIIFTISIQDMSNWAIIVG